MTRRYKHSNRHTPTYRFASKPYEGGSLVGERHLEGQSRNYCGYWTSKASRSQVARDESSFRCWVTYICVREDAEVIVRDLFVQHKTSDDIEFTTIEPK